MPIGKTRLAILVGLAPLLCWAGSLRLQDYDTGADITGTEVTFAWDPQADGATPGIERKIVTVNTGGKDLVVLARKEELGPLQPGVTNSFCYAGYCYAPHVFESPRPQTIPAGGSDREMRTGLKTAYSFNPARHIPGIDRVRFVVFDKDDRGDSASVIVNFSTLGAPSPVRPDARLREPTRMSRFPAGPVVDAQGRRRPVAASLKTFPAVAP